PHLEEFWILGDAHFRLASPALQVELCQGVKEFGAVVRVRAKVNAKVVVGKEEALDAPPLDLVYHFVYRTQAYAPPADTNGGAEVAVARAAAGDLQIGRPVVVVFLHHLDHPIRDRRDLRQVRPRLVLVDRAQAFDPLGGKMLDSLRPGEVTLAYEGAVGKGLDVFGEQGGMGAAHDNACALSGY